ncbi:glycosyl hydrolase 115 family protein [Dyadobacter aurulentus]|uniref:glycosyl hydrolase 115 family protein n=1 Tax=Dyadobacter sp. UC 10 TaxID=2605428 RepID=UPI0011F33590|nr:glycosyl hydrolase 115 family protein [Dyadobacter sp. UC 10]KAA0988788.1 hypothetical protein FXO21_00710 [Dyadobacter sp. UC 10]
MRYSAIIFFLISAYTSFAQSKAKQPFTLVSEQNQATIILPETEPECVRLAVNDLVHDVAQINGKKLRVVSKDDGKVSGSKIHVGTVGLSDSQIKKYNSNAASLKGKWEVYEVKSNGGSLAINGSDERATMFGIYHFIEEYLKVDPLYFWSDKLPEKKSALQWERVQISQKSPSFQYRGWFINDEDLLTEFYESGGKRNIDYPYYGQVVNPALMSKVVESLVRQRLNLIIPASFIDIRNPAEAALVKEAAKRGVFISMHHVEPMGVSAFTFFNYWKEKTNEKPLFSFYSSREKLTEVWQVYAKEWAKYPNVIWQIGLRGIADRPMWMADPGVPQSDADRGKLISDAMATQMEIIKEVDKRPNPPITTTLWAEGSTLNQAGHLKIPEKVTIVFSDNSPGWKWQNDFYQTPRTNNNTYGVYYHHQLWGAGPHIAQGISPQHTYQVFQEVQKMKSNAYAIMNVSNIREFQLGLASSAHMLYNLESYDPQVFMKEWTGVQYGQHAAAAKKAYDLYFESFVVHDKQRVAMLLDGQTRNFALNYLKKLSQQISDPEAYQAAELKAKQASTESDWGKTSLSDAHPQPRDENELLEKVQKQQQAHQNALTESLNVLAKLETLQKTFFETNLISQTRIMLGLEEWLKQVLLAKKAMHEGQPDQCKNHLQLAVKSIDGINEGKAMNVKSDKWANWYRGDKKMNINACKDATEKVYKLLK